jgi:vacuolar protein sorting-associated protein 3
MTPCVGHLSNYVLDRQIFFYIIPSLEPVPGIKPIRNVMAFAVDHQHIVRPAPSVDPPAPILPVDFCIVKRNAIVLYSLQEQLMYRKVSETCSSFDCLHIVRLQEIPLQGGAFVARRIGQCLCIADRERYSLVYLDKVTATPILPISQTPSEPGMRPHRPKIAVVAEEDFLILSWTGAGTMGVFINVNGDPVRGTLQWPSHPLSICVSSSLPTFLG